jgi:hypothetical protein
MTELNELHQSLLDSERGQLARPHDISDIARYTIDLDFDTDIREMLMTLEFPDDPQSDRTLDLHRCLIMLQNLEPSQLMRMRLDYSLCPLHACDYAICFDDNDDECEIIRTMHPEHDT